MKTSCLQLWQLCFSDSPAFTELYFRLRYTDKQTEALWRDGRVVSAMQLLPYPLSFCGSVVPMAYVSGACTHPAYRGQGLMTDLLEQALRRMRREGVAVSALIPAEPGLWDFYSRVGYAPAFSRRWEVWHPSEAGQDGSGQASALDSSVRQPLTFGVAAEDVVPEVYRRLYRQDRSHPCYVLHTRADLRVVMEAVRLWGGQVWTLRQGRRLRAWAVGWPDHRERREVVWLEAGTWRTEGDRRQLLAHICCSNHVDSVLAPPAAGHSGQSQPLGMARLVDVPCLLTHFARCFPSSEMTFHLTDPQLTANTGYYVLRNGQCTTSSRPLPGVAQWDELTPAALARRLFDGLAGEMRLMLD